MNDHERKRSSHVLDTVDTFMAAVPWTKNRTVIVYEREHSGKRYIRLRTFNRHREKGVWYPSPRFFMVPMESAASLGQAIIEVAKGKPFGDKPDWWTDFEKQYAALPRSRKDADKDQNETDDGDS